MPKSCFQLHEEIKALGEETFRTGVNWVALANGVDISAKDAEGAFRELVAKTGMSPETARNSILRGFGMEAKRQNAADFERASMDAEAAAGEMGNPTGILRAYQRGRNVFVQGLSRMFGGFQNMNVTEDLKSALVRYGGHQWLHELRPGVFTGKEQGEIWKNELRRVYDSLESKPDWETFRKATTAILSSRNKYGEHAVDRSHWDDLLKKIQTARQTKGQDYASEVESIIHSANALSQNKPFMDWVWKQADALDGVGEFLQDAGVIQSRKPGFFHNAVRMEMDSPDPLENALFGKPGTPADFAKMKQFRSPMEAFLAGYEPVSWNADDIMAMYHDKVGRRTALWAARKDIEKNEGSWKIYTHDAESGEAAFSVGKEGKEPPKSLDGRLYQNLGNYQRQLGGIYAHPDIAEQWAQKVFGKVGGGGFVQTYRRTNEVLKQMAFTFDMFHAVTLGTKVVELGGAFGMFINPFTSVRAGLDAIAARDPRIVKAIEQGLTLTREQWESDLLKRFSIDSQTGRQKENLWSRIASLGGISTVVTQKIFHAWQPGWKAGLVLQLSGTEQFRKWVEQGGEQYAYHNLATLLNNHLGGQNLVSLGRSRMAQAFVQAGFLAPDFQESKWRKNFGILHQDENLRRVYQASLGIELALTVTGIMALQAIIDELTGQPSRFDGNWFNDSVSHWLDVRVGKSTQGKYIYVTPFGSNREDFRPVLSLLAREHDAWSQNKLGVDGFPNQFKGATLMQRVLDPVMGDLKHEVANKFSPPLRTFEAQENKPFGYPKKMSLFGQTSEFGLPVLPISVQSMLYSARGGFGGSPEDRLKWVLASAATTLTGTPLSEGKDQSKKKDTGGKISLFR